MSKIDELLAKISACNRNRQVLVKAFDDEVQKYEKEIADLEAESARPREVWFSPDMRLFQTTLPETCASIHFREVKPLVITREMAKKMWQAGFASNSSLWCSTEAMASIVKAAGIDAIPEGGK